jgi:hypothetical protein
VRAAFSPRGEAAAPAAQPDRPTSRFGANLYYWVERDTLRRNFATDPRVAANREAIEAWIAHARDNGYRLVFLLFPPREAFDDPELFAEMREWLGARGVEFLDFSELFRREALAVDQLYWKVPTNGHWNSNGNRIVGRLLAEWHQASLRARSPSPSSPPGSASPRP